MTFAFHQPKCLIYVRQKPVGSSDWSCAYCWQHLGKTESADFPGATQIDGNYIEGDPVTLDMTMTIPGHPIGYNNLQFFFGQFLHYKK